MKISILFGGLLAACAATSALADINVGVTLPLTGPASALGIPEKNAIALFPTSIAGETINWIVLDDATNPTLATKNSRKLVTESNVDLLVGSSSVPTCLSVAEVAIETKTPQIAIAPMDLPQEKNYWIFRTPQHVRLMAQAVVKDMKARGYKEVGFIGYTDAWGESWLKEMTPLLAAEGMKFSQVERYARTDTSVAGQVLKLMAANPPAILIVGSGTPAALPQTALIERGYKGQLYQSHGAASREFLRVAGKSAERTIFPVGPVLVANQLPADNPVRPVAMKFVEDYEKAHGAGSVNVFAAHMFDAWKLLEAAVPVALKKAKPGTAEFRQALRDAMEGIKNVVGAHGVYNMTPTDHFGHDERARVMIYAENGEFKLGTLK